MTAWCLLKSEHQASNERLAYLLKRTQVHHTL